jgi:glycerol-3-phosphate dehydrogenase (NAD(P)+)
VLQLGERAGVPMPIVEHVVKVLYDGMSPEDALLSLMTREAEPEFLGLEQ